MSRRVGFDYGNTCPRIDRAIDAAKDTISQHVDSLLEQACPLLSDFARKELARQYAEDLYSDLEDVFEEARSSNIDMREEAEKQIVALQDEVESLEFDLKNLEASA